MRPLPLDAIANLIRLGTVETVDVAAARCRVRSGELLTAPLPWLALRAGQARTWSAPSVGEQVVLLAPGGHLGEAVVLLGLYASATPAPSSDAQQHLVLFEDGALVAYDGGAHVLRAVLPGGGRAELVAPGGVSITGDVSIDGEVTVSGGVVAQQDVVGKGVSLATHRHGGVSSGTSTSGPPL